MIRNGGRCQYIWINFSVGGCIRAGGKGIFSSGGSSEYKDNDGWNYNNNYAESRGCAVSFRAE